MNNDEKAEVKTLRIINKDFERFGTLSKKNNMTKAEMLVVLMNSYEKNKDRSEENILMELLKLKEEKLAVENKIKLLEGIIEVKNINAESLRKEFLKILEENMIIKLEIEELELKVNKTNLKKE